MTAAELVKKQSHQQRIDAHVQADRKAKRREFDQRYGNSKRPPQGRNRPARRTHQPRKQPSVLLQLLLSLAAIVTAAIAVHHILSRV